MASSVFSRDSRSPFDPAYLLPPEHPATAAAAAITAASSARVCLFFMARKYIFRGLRGANAF